jgi:hypothetical protein
MIIFLLERSISRDWKALSPTRISPHKKLTRAKYEQAQTELICKDHSKLPSWVAFTPKARAFRPVPS